MATTTALGKEEKKRVEIYDLEENLAVDLAKFTAHLSDKFCKERGAFTVVVSGGSLIKSLRYVSYYLSLISDLVLEKKKLFGFRGCKVPI